MNNSTLIVIATQHLDVAWMWRRSPEGEDLMIACFRRAVSLLDRHPAAGFKFSRSTVWSFAVLEEREPELFERVRDYVRAGRIECTGGQWVEPDNMIPSGESHIRQLLYGQLYLLERFGIKARVCWAPDVFAHGNSLPQILSECGIQAYYSHRCEPLHDDGEKRTVFRWVSPDGSEVLFLGGHWYGMPDQADGMKSDLRSRQGPIFVTPSVAKTIAKTPTIGKHGPFVYRVGRLQIGPGFCVFSRADSPLPAPVCARPVMAVSLSSACAYHGRHSCVHAFVVFFVFQRYIAGGLTSGSVRG